MDKETEDPSQPAFLRLLKDHPAVSLGNRNNPPFEIWCQYNARQSSGIERKNLGERNQRIVIAKGLDDLDQLGVLVKDSPDIAKSGHKISGTKFYGYRLSIAGELRPLLSPAIAQWQGTGDANDPLHFVLAMGQPAQFSEPSDSSSQSHLALMKLSLTISGQFQEYVQAHSEALKPIPVWGGYRLPDHGSYGIKLRERLRFELDSSKRLLPWFMGVKNFEEFAKTLHLSKATE